MATPRVKGSNLPSDNSLSFFQGLFIQIDYDQAQNGKTGARVGVCFKLRFNDQALTFIREEIPFMFICKIVVITATH